MVFATQCSPATAQMQASTHKVSTMPLRLPFGGLILPTLPNVVVYHGRRNLRLNAKADDDEGGNLGDDMLDFLYAGKKLRKW
jgi:hypothetical protein